MRYKVYGVNAQTGQDVVLNVEAGDPAEASKQANHQGIYVGYVKPTPKSRFKPFDSMIGRILAWWHGLGTLFLAHQRSFYIVTGINFVLMVAVVSVVVLWDKDNVPKQSQLMASRPLEENSHGKQPSQQITNQPPEESVVALWDKGNVPKQSPPMASRPLEENSHGKQPSQQITNQPPEEKENRQEQLHQIANRLSEELAVFAKQGPISIGDSQTNEAFYFFDWPGERRMP